MAEQMMAPPRPPFRPLPYDEPDLRAAMEGRLEDVDWPRCREMWAARLGMLLGSHATYPARPHVDKLLSFDAPPHTVQRLAELLHHPDYFYADADKFYRAVGRVLSVTSTVADFPADRTADDVVEDALLVPIPWLVNADGTLNGGGLPPTRPAGIGEGERTMMPNGVTITTGAVISDFEDFDSNTVDGAATGAEGVVAPRAAGSAPIDATDVGIQPQAVLDTIAAAGAPANAPPPTASTQATEGGESSDDPTTSDTI